MFNYLSHSNHNKQNNLFHFFPFCIDNIIDLQSESSVSTKNIEKPCFMYMVDTTILQILYVSFIK